MLTARCVDTPERNVRLHASEVHWVPDEAYRLREASEMSISSDGYVPVLYAAARKDGSVPI